MIKKTPTYLLLVLLAFFFSNSALAAKPYKAPEWEIEQWFNGTGTTVAALKGKVVVVDFFQLWCPGCKTFSIPTVNKWESTFKKEVEEQQIAFVGIHTVFEGHEYQNSERLAQFLKDMQIHHLVGNDKHVNGDLIPETMKRFRTRGTPEVLIIDKQGIVRFQHFGKFDVAQAEMFIRDLLEQP